MHAFGASRFASICIFGDSTLKQKSNCFAVPKMACTLRLVFSATLNTPFTCTATEHVQLV